MRYRQERSYWPLYLAAVLAWIGMFLIPRSIAIYRAEEVNEIRFYKNRPGASVEEVKALFEKVKKASDRPTNDAKDYFVLLVAMTDMEAAIRKGGLLNVNGNAAEYHRLAIQPQWLLRDLQTGYEKKYGQHALVAAREELKKGSDRVASYLDHAEGNYVPTAAPETWPLVQSVWFAWLPFAAFIMLLRLYQVYGSGWSIVIEAFANPHKLALAIVGCPFSLLKYPNEDCALQVRRGLQVATGFLVTAVSAFAGGGIATAAPKAPSGKDGKKNPWSLQLDARTGRLVEAATGPDPNSLLRATLTAPSGMFIDTINAKRGNFQSNWTVVGHPIKRLAGFTLYGIGGMTFDSTHSRSWLGGVELFGKSGRLAVAIPELTIERQIAPRTSTTFANTTRLYLKHKRLQLGVDTGIRMPVGRTTSWTAGPVAGFTVNKNTYLEVGVIRNHLGDWRGRLRLVKTFAFDDSASGVAPPSANEKPSFTVTSTSSYASRYVGGTIGIEIYNKKVFQQDITLSHSSGFYAGTWMSFSPPQGWNSDGGDEMDYTIGCQRNILNGSVGLNAGYSYFNIFDLKTGRGDIGDTYLNVALAKHPLQPYVRFDWLLASDSELAEGGLNYRLGIRPVARGVVAKHDLVIDLSLAGHDGLLGFPTERVSSAKIGLSTTLPLPAGFAVTPSVALQKSFGGTTGVAKDRFWYGASLSRSFTW